MKIVAVGGGPAGLYFAILMKKADPANDITVLERNGPNDTFGFGVVFSDAALDSIADADRPVYDAITKSFFHWDDIDIHFKGEVLRSSGHGFSGLSRQVLLNILQRRAEELGVKQVFQTDVADLAPWSGADLILGADGANSTLRAKYAEHFKPSIDWRPNRFVWLGTTFPFKAFTFYFKEDASGLWRVHAYRYDREHSTFIVETTEAAWRKAGLENATEDQTIAFCERLFAKELAGHKLLKNRSLWRSFPIIRCARWRHGNVVLAGDSAHTAHFSIGSGTKLALEDALALRDAVVANKDLPAALETYENVRLPQVESYQRAAQVSLQWFEDTERYMDLEPIQFGFSLLTRSLRVTHENLRLRDPAYVASIDRWFAKVDPAPPPLFTPFKLRGLHLENRVVVSPMCQYSAEDGVPNDWHLVHLGSRAMGGAGLVFTEMTDVSREGRISPGCTGMYKPDHVAAWKRIVDFVHAGSRAKIGMQLAHAGRKASTRLAWEGMDEPLPDGNWPILSASPIPWFPHSQVPREMTRTDMDKVRDDFARAARMAEECGFDILELHFAHGYLISSFISPLSNVRKDEYGGSLENRMRFPLEVFDAVRQAWPEAKPISVRISATDWAPGGIEAAHAVEVARMLKARGCDIIDVSAGQTVAHAKPVYGRQFQTPLAERVRIEAGIPTMAVGNISSYSDVNSILAAGRADLCVLARAHLWDPYWTRHAAHALGHPLPWPDPYTSLKRYTPRFT
ncbi:MAG TPA: bifunctional salicylyl-CoA 5-hydroxylase/oxidoreductase [Planctomycetota bacterium]|nr:bifunctional salicylyl-CoA 5-hydroxylase/oxidoreductase [Planctomycetota bacterium]